MRQSWETMTSVSAGHIILTPTQPVGSGRPQRESNPGAPHQESRALPTELPRPPSYTGLTHLTNVSFSTVTDLCLKFEVCVYHQASLVYGAGCRLLRVWPPGDRDEDLLLTRSHALYRLSYRAPRRTQDLHIWQMYRSRLWQTLSQVWGMCLSSGISRLRRWLSPPQSLTTRWPGRRPVVDQESRALPTELPRPPSYTGLTHLTNVSFSTVTDLCLKFEVCVYHQASLVYGAGCRLLRVWPPGDRDEDLLLVGEPAYVSFMEWTGSPQPYII